MAVTQKRPIRDADREHDYKIDKSLPITFVADFEVGNGNSWPYTNGASWVVYRKVPVLLDDKGTKGFISTQVTSFTVSNDAWFKEWRLAYAKERAVKYAAVLQSQLKAK